MNNHFLFETNKNVNKSTKNQKKGTRLAEFEPMTWFRPFSSRIMQNSKDSTSIPPPFDDPSFNYANQVAADEN
jgi:hypothetical protein